MAVDHLLVREHGLVARAPVDRRLPLVGQAPLEQLQEEPLGPPVVRRGRPSTSSRDQSIDQPMRFICLRMGWSIDWSRELSDRPTPRTTAGRSGSSCCCSSAAWSGDLPPSAAEAGQHEQVEGEREGGERRPCHRVRIRSSSANSPESDVDPLARAQRAWGLRIVRTDAGSERRDGVAELAHRIVLSSDQSWRKISTAPRVTTAFRRRSSPAILRPRPASRNRERDTHRRLAPGQLLHDLKRCRCGALSPPSA